MSLKGRKQKKYRPLDPSDIADYSMKPAKRPQGAFPKKNSDSRTVGKAYFQTSWKTGKYERNTIRRIRSPVSCPKLRGR